MVRGPGGDSAGPSIVGALRVPARSPALGQAPVGVGRAEGFGQSWFQGRLCHTVARESTLALG